MKKGLRLMFVAAAALMLAQTTVHAVPIWTEVGDAAGLNDPQRLVGGPFDVIAGNVGPGDGEDAYAFHWLADGDFSVIDTEPQLPVGVMLIALYSFANSTVGSALTPYADSKVGFAVADLLAGDYLMHVLFDDDGKDPPYFLQLSGAIQAIELPVRVPAPGNLALIGLAALALFVARLRRC